MVFKIGQCIDEKYEIKKWLGEGATGTVWLGYDKEINKNVAIKELQAAFKNDSVLRERFREEAKATAQLDHPNIVYIRTTKFSGEMIILSWSLFLTEKNRRLFKTS
jgi:serine/threonine protein kinase